MFDWMFLKDFDCDKKMLRTNQPRKKRRNKNKMGHAARLASSMLTTLKPAEDSPRKPGASAHLSVLRRFNLRALRLQTPHLPMGASTQSASAKRNLWHPATLNERPRCCISSHCWSARFLWKQMAGDVSEEARSDCVAGASVTKRKGGNDDNTANETSLYVVKEDA